jgi:amino acid adenylation domain-containing protein
MHEALESARAIAPGKAAVIGEDASLSYEQLRSGALALASHLASQGIRPGDRVGLLLDNGPDAVLAVFGVLACGGVVVPITSAAKPQRVAYICNDCGIEVLIASPEHATTISQARAACATMRRVVWTGQGLGVPADEPQLREVLASPPGARATIDAGLIDHDLAAIIYTSGTTGEPKGVMLTHRNLVNTSGAIAQYLGNHRGDVVLSVLPMAFSYGLFQALVSVRVASTLVLGRSFTFPFEVLKRIREHRVTGMAGVPTMFAKILQLLPNPELDLASVRYMTNAAAGISPSHALALGRALPHVAFFPMYGQTECTRACYLDPTLVRDHPDSVGRAIPNCELYLIDEHGARLPHGSQGELVVRGANVMRGYWARAEDTERKLRPGPIVGERVLHTGDLFRTDAHGLLYFVGRTDDIFKCRGEKVAPQLIENVLCELPDVAEAAIIGIDDPADGTAIKAFVVPKAGATLTEGKVRQHCKARLEAVFMPKVIEFRESLPTTASGKLRRRDLA